MPKVSINNKVNFGEIENYNKDKNYEIKYRTTYTVLGEDEKEIVEDWRNADKYFRLEEVDKTAPVIIIAPYDTEWTNKDIVVTATVDKGTLNATSHTFTANDSFTFTATDEAGNTASKTVKITNIDKVAPTVTITNEDGKITVEAKDNDGGSGIGKKFFKLDSNDWVNEMPSLTELKDGKHTIQAKATDLAGNESKVETLDFYTADEAIKAGEDALKALEKAERTKAKEDIVTAQNLINIAKTKAEVLDNENPNKTTLLENVKTMQNRLDNIKNNNEQEKALEEATKAVEKAEESKIQSDVDSARSLVNKLPFGEDRTSLNARLDKVQAEIDVRIALEKATKAVEKAEKTKIQVDVDSARNLVNKLPEGKDKNDLNVRLDKVQAEIDKQKEQQEKALEEATKAVEKAETTIEQADVDFARNLVNKLHKCKEKTVLENRLDKVQAEINAKRALEEAIKAVEKAEETEIQANVNAAYLKVNKLPNSQEKTALINRLKAIEKKIAEKLAKEKAEMEAIKAVEIAELYKRNPYIQNAKDKVMLLKDGELKTTLEERLAKLEQESPQNKAKINKAENLVKLVEKYKKFGFISRVKQYIPKAQEAINELDPSEKKIELQERLDICKEGLSGDAPLSDEERKAKKDSDNATMFVELYETYGYTMYYRKAEQLVKALPEGEEKTALMERLGLQAIENVNRVMMLTFNVKTLENAKITKSTDKTLKIATKYVEEAEKSNLETVIKVALEKVNKLPTSQEKEALLNRLEALK